MASKKKRSNRKVWIIVTIIILGLVAIGILNKESDAIRVEAENPTFRNIVSTVSASGKIMPETEIKIISEVSGQVTELSVKEGDNVEKGELLLKINPEIYRTALQRADAALSSSRSALANAKASEAQANSQLIIAENTFNRSKELHQSGAISTSEYESALSQFEVAQAQFSAAKESVNSARFGISSAKASKDEANENLGRTSIYAPQSGIVTALSIEEGDVILGTGMTKGDELMRISDLSIMEVDVEVNESDIVRVNLKDTVLVEVDAYPDRKFKGLVTEIANTALNSGIMNTSQVTNFSVKIRILEQSYADLVAGKEASFSPFRSGMSANVDIQTDYINNVLSVPITAVTTRTDTTNVNSKEKHSSREKDDSKKEDEEEFTVVFVRKGDIAEIRIVELGIQDDEFYQIKSGVSKDDDVIIGPYNAISKVLENGEEVQDNFKFDKD